MGTFIPELTTLDGKPAVTSRQISEDFEKAHFNVIQSIETLEVSDKFRELNFQFSEYTVEGQTRKYKQYLLTRDGFTMVVMGFSGKKAIEFKEAYIEAFNKMESALVPDQSRQTYDRINTAQKKQIEQQIHQLFNSWAFTEGNTQHAYNRIRCQFNLNRYEDLPADQFNNVLGMIKDMESKNYKLMGLFIELRQQYLQDYIESGAPWTPALKTKWKKIIQERLPERPNWVEMQKRVEGAKPAH